MSYKLKTLIVFDTNSLRSTDAGEVAYSFFAFGRPFQVIESFIVEKNLAEDVLIAIPTWAIEELKDQKTGNTKQILLNSKNWRNGYQGGSRSVGTSCAEIASPYQPHRSRKAKR